MILRIKVSFIATILFAGGWCLSQTKGNVFFLGVDLKTYLTHVSIWLGLFILIYVTLLITSKRSIECERRISLFIIMVSSLNLIDYGLRSIFGQVSTWPKTIIVSWAAFTLIFPGSVAYAAFKMRNIEKSVIYAVRICTIPCILFIYYALPGNFTCLKLDKPFRDGNRPSVHLLLFDMLSYDILFKDGMVDPSHPNFKSFSIQSDIFLNCRSPGESTDQVIPKLLTGKDFKKIGHMDTQWIVGEPADGKEVLLSSFETFFSVAYEAGYNVFIQAFALPYINNFENYIQSGQTFPFDNLWRAGMHSLVWPMISPGGIQHQETTNSMLENYLTRIKENDSNTFYYSHWNIPHDPFIFDANGKMLSRFELIKQLIMRPERKHCYINQLVGTDVVFGKIMRALKDNGAYEKSLIIVIADTNVKDLNLDMNHVPLIIKHPNQSATKLIKTKVTSQNLKSYLKHFIQTGKCNEKLLKVK